MDKYRLYRRAYRLLENAVPMDFDCGLLCDKKCCGGDSDAGMHLYPGEEAMYRGQAGFLSLRPERFNGLDIRFATCRSTCDRQFRPLACRIYPCAPYLAPDGRLHIVEDPRAYYQCPLLYCGEELSISALFKRKARDVFRLLLQDPDIKAYVNALSPVLEEYAGLTGKPLVPGQTVR